MSSRKSLLHLLNLLKIKSAPNKAALTLEDLNQLMDALRAGPGPGIYSNGMYMSPTQFESLEKTLKAVTFDDEEL